MDVRQRLLKGPVRRPRRDESGRAGWRHDHAHARREPLDPGVVAERRHARPQQLIAPLQRRAAFDRAPDAGAELQHLDLHRHDPRQHQAEHEDPRLAADEAVDQRAVRERA
jgi:hypothetical protein